MNFKDQSSYSSPLLSTNNILKFSNKITLEIILFVSKSTKGKRLLYFITGLHFQETYGGVKFTGL